MAKPTTKPRICTNCNHIFQHEKRTTSKMGVIKTYVKITHLDSLPRLGLEEGLCLDCERLIEQRENND